MKKNIKKQLTLTNLLLAIIAFCLVFNLLVNGNLIAKAYAGDTKGKPGEPMEVKIVGVQTWDSVDALAVEIKNVRPIPVSQK